MWLQLMSVQFALCLDLELFLFAQHGGILFVI